MFEETLRILSLSPLVPTLLEAGWGGGSRGRAGTLRVLSAPLLTPYVQRVISEVSLPRSRKAERGRSSWRLPRRFTAEPSRPEPSHQQQQQRSSVPGRMSPDANMRECRTEVLK